MEFTEKDLGFFSKFESITRVMPSDYYASDELLVFLVNPTQMGRSIGKKASNIAKLRKAFGKKVVIVPDNEKPEAFVRSFFNNVSIAGVEVREAMGEMLIVLTVDEKDRGIAIGKNGERIKAAKSLLKRKFNASVQLKTRRSI